MSEIRVKYIDIPLQFSQLRAEIMPKVEEVLASGNYILGPAVAEFEERFAHLCGSKFALGVADGSDALFLALKVFGVGPGDEVITAPNSFLASAWTIVAAGARPVFADVREDFNIDPEQIEKVISPHTKAIMPVHLTGRPADMGPIMDIARRRGLAVVEDAAQAVAARYRGKGVGAIGDIGCFSLHPLKNLNAAGDAGVMTTNNEDYYKLLLKLRNHGLKNRDECEVWGFNSRLDTVQAALLNVKLNHIEAWTNKLREVAGVYRAALASYVKVPTDQEHEYSVYHTFIIQTDRRNELRDHLLARGVETKIHYPIPIHLQECARELGYNRGDFPVTERQSSRILSLPIYPEITDRQVSIVIEEVKKFFGA